MTQITNLTQVQKLHNYGGIFTVDTGNVNADSALCDGEFILFIKNKKFAGKRLITDDFFPLTFVSWVTPPPLKAGEEVWCDAYTQASSVKTVYSQGVVTLHGKCATINSCHALPTRLLEEEKGKECKHSFTQDTSHCMRCGKRRSMIDNDLPDTTKEEYEHYTCPELENAKKLVDSFLSDWEKFKLNKGE